MHYCRLCQFISKHKWVVERHTKSKHKDIKNNNNTNNNNKKIKNNKSVLLCGNCEMITTSLDKMIRHKKEEHNIIYSQTSLEHSLINAVKGEGGEGSGENDGEMGVGEGDVIKGRAWNNPSFKERGYDSYI